MVHGRARGRWAWTRRPWVIAFCIAIVVYAVQGASPSSAVYRAIYGPRGVLINPTKFTLLVIIEQNTTTVIAPWSEEAPASEGDLWSRAASGEILVYTVSYSRYVYRAGFLGLTQKVENRTLLIAPEPTPQKRAAIAQAVLDCLDASTDEAGLQEYAKELREFQGRAVRTLPWGYVWNSIVLVASCITLIGLTTWGTGLPQAIREHRRRKMLARGCCPKCGYSMQGLEGACPECGTQMD